MNQTAYIVAGYRTAVGKAPRGGFRFTRTDDLAAEVIKHLVASVPALDPARVDDVIVGNAVPEAEQGLQIGRMISLLSLPMNVSGMVVNRYCGSGVETIAMAVNRITGGMADCIIAGGAENMSMVPTVGWKTVPNYNLATKYPQYYLGMGLTAEALAKLRPVFAAGGSVTAGNSSQTSDGAAFVIVMSERMVKELNLEPIARMVTYATEGIDPRIMGMGPVKAIPKALKQAGMQLGDIDLFELNEAFASQSIAVMRELGMDPDKTNVNGGAIALGHPLGCSGAKLSIQLFDELRERGQKYGMVTACVGGGQGVAGIYELLK